MNSTDVVGWAPEPQARGTVGLIWSCLATIFLCTWNAVHPNLPGMNDNAWRIFGRRVAFMLIALVAPEFIFAAASEELRSALAVQAQSPGWSLTQSFFLNMGGFQVKVDGDPVSLDPYDVIVLFGANIVSWPGKSLEYEILDRSKADWVLKSFALVQTICFVSQTIGRATQHLPVTTLELFTLGIISCTLFTYMAWWAKPFDIRSPIILEAQKPLPRNMPVNQKPSWFWVAGQFAEKSTKVPALTACITIVFGALHLVAWQFFFPSEIERWFWRASSIVCIALPLLMVVLSQYTLKWARHDWPFWICAALYVLCRTYMVVEMFLSLRAVPADVYRTPQWSQYFLFG